MLRYNLIYFLKNIYRLLSNEVSLYQYFENLQGSSFLGAALFLSKYIFKALI